MFTKPCGHISCQFRFTVCYNIRFNIYYAVLSAYIFFKCTHKYYPCSCRYCRLHNTDEFESLKARLDATGMKSFCSLIWQMRSVNEYNRRKSTIVPRPLSEFLWLVTFMTSSIHFTKDNCRVRSNGPVCNLSSCLANDYITFFVCEEQDF